MPTVDTEILIEGVSRETLWQTLIDFESYPNAMQDVLHVAWDHRDEHGGISTWRVLLNGSELSWSELDTSSSWKESTSASWKATLRCGRGIGESTAAKQASPLASLSSSTSEFHPWQASCIRSAHAPSVQTVVRCSQA